MRIERRTSQGYKLRVYLEAIKEAKATSDEEWIDRWAKEPSYSPYISRITWIAYLEQCVIREAGRLIEKAVA